MLGHSINIINHDDTAKQQGQVGTQQGVEDHEEAALTRKATTEEAAAREVGQPKRKYWKNRCIKQEKIQRLDEIGFVGISFLIN